jgi:hypothetical protein
MGVVNQARALLALTFALLSGGCIDNGGYTGSQTYGPVDCTRFTSCAACTPVLGCGWCWMGNKGACVDQPNACAGVANFSWTWELSGCPDAPDAGATTDGSASASD